MLKIEDDINERKIRKLFNDTLSSFHRSIECSKNSCNE